MRLRTDRKEDRQREAQGRQGQHDMLSTLGKLKGARLRRGDSAREIEILEARLAKEQAAEWSKR